MLNMLTVSPTYHQTARDVSSQYNRQPQPQVKPQVKPQVQPQMQPQMQLSKQLELITQTRLAKEPNDLNDTNEESKDDALGGKSRFDRYYCQTCQDRKYQDGSDDPGVSFKTPTNISPESSASAVRSHEQEHVSRERAAAARDGREVISQSVSYRMAVCPECGTNYISGGTTSITSKDSSSKEESGEMEG